MTSKRDSGRKAPVKPLLSRKKIWGFRILSLVILPIIFFGVLEAALRLAGFGYPTKALLEHDIEEETWCFENPQYGWQFFPRKMARSFDPHLAFRKEKAPETFRIFVLGASAARGDPQPLFHFGRHLNAMLTDMYPDIRFEMHNAAIVAINSHVVREIARDCAEYEPDLFIVYVGNNEVLGPFGPGTVLTRTPPALPLIRANIAAKKTRIGQLIDVLAKSAPSHGRAPQEWGGLAMFLEKQVRADSLELEPVYQNYEMNLLAICRIARRAGIPVILSSVGANLRDCPPFGSLHREGLNESEMQTWQALYQEGVDLETRGQFAPAIERYTAAATIDDTFADLQFRLGRCYEENDDYENAQAHYRLALQYDTLRFRADEQLNDIIRRTAKDRENEGIYFVDSREALQAGSQHRIPGSDLFFDHVHLTHRGNYIVARTLFPIVQQLLPATAKAQDDLLNETEVARSIAYTKYDELSDLDRMYLTLSELPPFTTQLYHDEAMRNMKAELETLRSSLDLDQCQREYDQAIRENPEDWRLLVKQYDLLLDRGIRNLAIMEQLWRRVITLHPHFGAYQYAGDYLLHQGRLHEAEEALQKVLLLNPVSAKAHSSLADVALKRGNRDGVIRHLRQAIKLDPAASVAPYGVLAQQYDSMGKTEKAVRTLKKALTLFPENETARIHFDLGKLLYKKGDRVEALQHMNTALRIYPGFSRDRDFMIQYNRIK